MTTQQLVWITFGYAVGFLVVLHFTRATPRRALGALVGGVVASGLFLGLYRLGVEIRWWRGSLPSTLGLWTLFYLGAAISLSPVYALTWRIAQRFGRYGLWACLLGAALIGPPRDFLIARLYPAWIVFTPGIAPVLAVAATYVSVVALGHAVMWLVAGPALADPLARRPSRAA
jgi:hypothetical protein